MLKVLKILFSSLLLILLMISTSFSQGWVLQPVSVSGADLKAIQFLNTMTGYCVGQTGTIIKTTNGGTNWISQTSGTTETLNDVYFLDALTGYAVGNAPFTSGDGVILKTTNGGTNWVMQASNSSGNNLYCVYFFSASVGIAGKETGSGDTSSFVVTSDGGATWEKLFAGPVTEIYSMHFPTPTIGYATGSQASGNNAYVLSTSSAGSGWTYGFSSSLAIQLDIFFPNSTTGYSCGFFGTIVKTTNSGGNWTALTTGHSATDNYFGVHFTSVSTGYVVGSREGTASPRVLKTTDGGSTWTEQTTGETRYMESVFFADDNTGWICGRFGIIMKTTTGGVTVGISNINSQAEDFNLSQNYPNPFNPETKIRFSVLSNNGRKSGVSLTVHDASGKEVAILVNEELNTGTYEYSFNGTGLASGIYFYKLSAGEFTETKKMLLIK